MSSGLATRCPACHTVFRVVRDQLRVSGGWVRCGRCSEVFDAGQSLLDLDTGLPWVEPSPPPAPAPAPVRHPPALAPFATPSAPPAAATVAPAASTAQTPASTLAPTPADPVRDRAGAEPEPSPLPRAGLPAVFSSRSTNTLEQAMWRAPDRPADAPQDLFADPQSEPASWRTTPIAPPQPEPPEPPVVDPLWRQTEAPEFSPTLPAPAAAEWAQAAPPASRPPEWLTPGSPPPPSDLDPMPPLSVEHPALAEPPFKPSFVRAADRAQRWRHPRIRGWLLTTALIAALALLLQVGLVYRDLAAARLPVFKPMLELACAVLSCSVGPALAINSLVVESSGLVRIDRSHQYRLQVVLRNRAGIPVALPAVDVTLTDSVGGVVARKVLSAAEMGSKVQTLEAGQSLSLQATLQNLAAAGNGDAGASTLAGYTVEVFYP